MSPAWVVTVVTVHREVMLWLDSPASRCDSGKTPKITQLDTCSLTAVENRILEYLKYSERVVFVGPLQTAAGKASLHPQGTGSAGVAELGHTTERNRSRHGVSPSRGTSRGARKLPNGLGCFRHSTPRRVTPRPSLARGGRSPRWRRCARASRCAVWVPVPVSASAAASWRWSRAPSPTTSCSPTAAGRPRSLR